MQMLNTIIIISITVLFILYRSCVPVRGAVLEDGVGVSDTNNGHAHQMCGEWEGRIVMHTSTTLYNFKVFCAGKVLAVLV